MLEPAEEGAQFEVGVIKVLAAGHDDIQVHLICSFVLPKILTEITLHCLLQL